MDKPKTYKRKKAESARSHLDALPKKKPPVPDDLSGSGVVKLLRSSIRSAMKKGYTIDEIVDELNSQGFELSKPTIRKSLKPPKKTTKNPAKKTTKKPVNKTQEQANSATPQESQY